MEETQQGEDTLREDGVVLSPQRVRPEDARERCAELLGESEQQPLVQAVV